MSLAHSQGSVQGLDEMRAGVSQSSVRSRFNTLNWAFSHFIPQHLLGPNYYLPYWLHVNTHTHDRDKHLRGFWFQTGAPTETYSEGTHLIHNVLGPPMSPLTHWHADAVTQLILLLPFFFFWRGGGSHSHTLNIKQHKSFHALILLSLHHREVYQSPG